MSPAPPYVSGKIVPRKPSSPSLRKTSRGKRCASSHSRTWVSQRRPRRRFHGRRRDDLDPRIVVAQDGVVARSRERHSVGAVLTEPDPVSPAATEKDVLDLSLRTSRPRKREQHLGNFERLPDVEPLQGDLGSVGHDAHLDDSTRRAPLGDYEIAHFGSRHPRRHPPRELAAGGTPDPFGPGRIALEGRTRRIELDPDREHLAPPLPPAQPVTGAQRQGGRREPTVADAPREG